MFGRIKNWIDRGVVAGMINKAERDNAAAADTDFWTPSQDDRRRLAVAEVFIVAERQDGIVHPSQYGQAILHNVVDESEVPELADAATQKINRRVQRGQLG